jgi:hypothetical protein
MARPSRCCEPLSGAGRGAVLRLLWRRYVDQIEAREELGRGLLVGIGRSVT